MPLQADFAEVFHIFHAHHEYVGGDAEVLPVGDEGEGAFDGSEQYTGSLAALVGGTQFDREGLVHIDREARARAYGAYFRVAEGFHQLCAGAQRGGVHQAVEAPYLLRVSGPVGDAAPVLPGDKQLFVLQFAQQLRRYAAGADPFAL